MFEINENSVCIDFDNITITISTTLPQTVVIFFEFYLRIRHS